MERSSRSERSGISTALRERVWGQAAKRTVWAVTVVVFSPRRAMGSRMTHAVELLHCKQLVSQTTVEALCVTILPGAPRRDIQRPDLQRRQPLLNRFGHELWTIVAPDALGNAVDHKLL